MKIIRTKKIKKECRRGYSIRRLTTHPLSTAPCNMGLYETTIPRGHRVPMHAHGKLVELLHFKTDAVVITKKKKIYFKPGDFLILEKGEKHEIRAPKNRVVLIAIKIPNIVEDRISY